jgi:hypothetical protein
MINRDVFARDPLNMTIPNDGVAKLGEPSTRQEWDVLRYELENFVCDGEYKRGLDKILSTYLANLDKTTQPAAWVSGFYGSGKSHLVRVLEFLWRDAEFPDGATARGLVNLPDTIHEHLRELDIAGRRGGGLWSAAGTLGAGAGDSVRLAILAIMLRSAGLPERYAQGRFVLRLMQTGIYEDVKALVEAGGQDFQTELANLYVSQHLRRALLEVDPEFAAGEDEARTLIREQYRDRDAISEEEMLETMAEVLALKSGDRENPPCSLLVLDELQQYIGENTDLSTRVQLAVEACSSRFGSRILFVATGQSALQGTPLLQRLQGRFTVRVPLSDTDVEEVIRQVVLRKAPDKVAELRGVLLDNSGEIDRQLSGTRIAPNRGDDPVLIPDYPLLPARRRFWERVLRATDKPGASSQLRAQLRIVLEATQQVADDPVGTVIPTDLLYDHIAPDMLQTGVLLREVDDTIREQRDGSEEGELRSRLCALIFLIGQLPTEPGADTGVRATADTLADLLVQYLTAGSAPLRARIPELLGGLVESGTLMQVEGEYRLQTRESAEWTAAYQNAEARIRGDDARIAGDRAHELRLAVTEALRNIRFNQGASKTPRSIELHFSSDAPPADTGAVPVWVRDEWSVSEKTVRDEARAAGPDDPIVQVFLPRRGPEGLRKAIASYEAASEVLQGRPVPNTREGQEAYAAMETRQRTARASLDATIRSVLENARVLQGGGNEVVESSLRAAVEAAAWASLERLYPQFRVADDARWDTVIKRARQGSGDPLEPLGYEGDTDKHPASSKVLSFVGTTGKRGREVRDHFRAPPHGWPQDAVTGSLLALLSVGALRATVNGSPATVKEIDQTRIGVTEFRSEKTRIEPIQRIGVRKLLAEAGIDPRSTEEVPAAYEFLARMLELAASAGGEPPLPATPDTGYIQDIRALGGNELFIAVYENRERLRQNMASWRAAQKEIQARVPRWERLRRLVEHARPLSESEFLREQAEAIHRERALLDEPDPVPPLLNRVADLLRGAVTDAFLRYTEAFDTGLRKLEDSGSWQSLGQSERDSILGNHGLKPRSEPRLGNDAAVLDSLSATPLADWENSIDALPERFARANVEATKKLVPQAHRFRPPTATLKTREEVNEYLEGVKVEIMAHIEKGRPVIL